MCSTLYVRTLLHHFHGKAKNLETKRISKQLGDGWEGKALQYTCIVKL